MPKTAFLLVLSLAGFLNAAFAQQGCALSGTSEWSKQLSDAIADCDNRFTSPNGKLLLRIDTAGKIEVSEAASGHQLQSHSRAVGPPAMVSWSPRSDAFFINDGEESGMASTFRLFRVRNNRVVEDGTIERKAVGRFRRLKKCSSAAVDPNVWGFGWSPEGTSFYLLVQATADDPCGMPASFISMTVRLADGSVLEQLSEAATKGKFQQLLPQEVVNSK
jgi:hypothetical protein